MIDKAMGWIERAAQSGSVEAQYQLANHYLDADPTSDAQLVQGRRWLLTAAESGHRGAMVDLGAVYLQGVKRIALERNPYRAKLLFEQALHDRVDKVYEQPTGNGRGWNYTVESVNRWLARVPQAVQRLDLEDLEGAQRREAIEQWYAREQQRLRAQTPETEGAAPAQRQQLLDDLAQQRTVLLNAASN